MNTQAYGTEEVHIDIGESFDTREYYLNRETVGAFGGKCFLFLTYHHLLIQE